MLRVVLIPFLSGKLILALETFYSTGSVYYLLLTGKEWMALAT